MNQEQISKHLNTLNILCQDKDSFLFLMPVNFIELQLHDYPYIVKRPMDLGTVRANLASGLISSKEEFVSEVNLIWKNCKLYNLDGSEIYRKAEKMEKLFSKLMKSGTNNTSRNRSTGHYNSPYNSSNINNGKETNNENPIDLELVLFKKVAQLDELRLKEFV